MGRARGLLLAALMLAAAGAPVFAQAASPSPAIGIEEHLGSYVPLDAKFTLEDGTPVALGDLVDKPTILALVYYRCPNACDFLLTGMASVLKLLPGTPGRDYQVVTLTIDTMGSSIQSSSL